jgi:putative ABC transport system substrate-binding protein
MDNRVDPRFHRRALNRRRFVQGVGVAGLGLLAGCGRLPGQAQETAAQKVHRIGYLSGSVPDASPSFHAFQQGLGELGYAEGHNVTIEYRPGEGGPERLADAAVEFVQLPVDLIVTMATPATQAASRATSTLPIVFINVNDPVGLGIVASLARPGGNVTGLSTLSSTTGGKRLELLKEAVPGTSRVAVFWNAANAGQVLVFRAAESAAQALGLQLQSLELRGNDDLDSAFKAALGERADSLVVLPSVPERYSTRIADFAAMNQLPAMYSERERVAAGGLMGYEPDYAALSRRAAYYVDRILKGTKPADLPVEQPMTFEFVINLKTAHALGLTIPEHVLLQATEVLQ